MRSEDFERIILGAVNTAVVAGSHAVNEYSADVAARTMEGDRRAGDAVLADLARARAAAANLITSIDGVIAHFIAVQPIGGER